MKLDVECMRFLSKDDFRVLTAIEMGMRNHDLVPVELITSIAKLRHGGSHKILSTLLRHKLVAHAQLEYNGYRLSYLGYDLLALHALLARKTVVAVGSQIGVGKESDIFEAQDEEGNEVVIKIHRLGRTSFRTVRKNRDYMGHKAKSSWLYMSRIAATKEFAFMEALHANGFPTPVPIDHNRHIVVMSRINGFPMAQIKSGNMEGAETVFLNCINILRRLAQHGLVHCDFNEFNLLVDDTGTVTMIDFPQMISTAHPNASDYFLRDINCLIKFFSMKMRYTPSEDLLFDLEDVLISRNLYEDVLTHKNDVAEDEAALIDYVTRKGKDEESEEEETGGVQGDADEMMGRTSPVANETPDACAKKSGDEEEEGEEEEGEGSEEEEELSPVLREQVKQKVRRDRVKHHGKLGSRNMTKKRNKYGKIDKNRSVDSSW